MLSFDVNMNTIESSRLEPIVKHMSSTTVVAQTINMRDRILDAATSLLTVLPAAKITMEDIAREAGIVRSTVYKSFATKEELLNALFAKEMREHHKPALIRIYRSNPATLETLVELFMTQLNLALGYSLLDNTFNLARSPQIGEAVLSSAENRACCEEIWLPILNAYGDQGLLREGLDHHETVRWMTYQFVWLINHPTMLNDSDNDLRHYIKVYIFGAIWAHRAKGLERV